MNDTIDALISLTNNSSNVIAENAQKAIDYEKSLQSGEISKEEYLDLMQDLSDLVKVANAADDLNNQLLLEKTISLAIEAASLAAP